MRQSPGPQRSWAGNGRGIDWVSNTMILSFPEETPQPNCGDPAQSGIRHDAPRTPRAGIGGLHMPSHRAAFVRPLISQSDSLRLNLAAKRV
jgi:hypothetical protein